MLGSLAMLLHSVTWALLTNRLRTSVPEDRFGLSLLNVRKDGNLGWWNCYQSFVWHSRQRWMNFSSWSILRNHIHGMQRNVVFMIRLRMYCEVPGLITPAVKGLCMHCNVYGSINQSFWRLLYCPDFFARRVCVWMEKERLRIWSWWNPRKAIVFKS
jgi:hypothetical protein